MTINERDMTRLSLLMASLVSSPAQAVKLMNSVRSKPNDEGFASIVDALSSQIDAAAANGPPSDATLRHAVKSLIEQGSEPSVTAGRLLDAALENHR